MYADLVAGLPAEAREELDRDLGVDLWTTPAALLAKRAVPVEPGAPSWWHGDEEATQSWLQAMGVRLE